MPQGQTLASLAAGLLPPKPSGPSAPLPQTLGKRPKPMTLAEVIKAAILGGGIGMPSPYEQDYGYERAAAVGEGAMLGLPLMMGALKKVPQTMSEMAQAIKAARLQEGLAGEPGYAYHATNAERLDDIAQAGKLKTFGPSYGTDQSVWPDMSREKRAYFAEKPLPQFAPEEGMPVILRTKKDGRIFRESTGDLFARKPVDAKTLEYLGEDQKWHPVSSLRGKP